jgi:hypothetical protein
MKKRKPFLKPFDVPEGMQDDDLFAVHTDGTVIPLCPEVLGDGRLTIRKKLADIDRSSLFTLKELQRVDDTEN